ncbi:MAG: ATP-binding protein [Pseudomonadota bacterium]
MPLAFVSGLRPRMPSIRAARASSTSAVAVSAAATVTLATPFGSCVAESEFGFLFFQAVGVLEEYQMLKTLTIDEVIEMVKKTPEQDTFDWKSDFVIPNDPDKQGEFIKDLTAIANACYSSYGYIVYGIHPLKPDPIIGITQFYDDSKLQQFAQGKIEPLPEFLYYEISAGLKVVGVLQVKPTRRRPHIISVDLGKVRKGQIVIRRGSSTDGVTMKDLYEFFYGQTSDHFSNVVQQMRAHTQQQLANIKLIQELREQQNSCLQHMEIISGIPRGSIGAKW